MDRRAGCSAIKQKFGRVSPGQTDDLAGNCALESLGFKTFGFAAAARMFGNRRGRVLGLRRGMAGHV